jgi:hypothetical protein
VAYYTAVQESAEEKSLQLTTMLLRSTVVLVLSTLGCIKYVASNLATRLSNEKVCFRYLEIQSLDVMQYDLSE